MTHTSAWKLDNLDCRGCAAEIEEQVGSLDLVDSVRVDFAQKRMVVTSKENIDALVEQTAKKTEPSLSIRKEDSLTRSWTFRGIDCPSCAYGIEERLSKEEGVESVRLDYAKKKITITTKEQQPSSY